MTAPVTTILMVLALTLAIAGAAIFSCVVPLFFAALNEALVAWAHRSGSDE